ncbi:cytochrome c biogenesis CcdA family protein [Evansella cellulosilytica]|uniref:Cytochrome c biogenesis protein transmembrane region n=1 Tax=Evansella cellulosilytica (strain ATCC 21833 / DSM 2522 / FERM P-1141 / JCM 9156 / N-4) TaxID=649639 RepID=E6TTF9_EVAC2|nr:cytochrome c biogenesis protein CcdA [Evansella cellulosilytica]ADU29595.1 cytochrome c biogenesis protein transmembrane region [Evansella cellulosilytica DSM 2522]
MEELANVTSWAALFAGVISFISPCTLPLLPAYLSYITGMSVKELNMNKNFKVRKKLMIHSVFFLIGVSMIFLGLGLGMTYFGSWVQGLFVGDSGYLIQRFAGIFIIFMGLFVVGLFKFDWLLKERRFRFAKKPAGYLGSTFVGIGFAAGWTPCIGPMFGAILLLAASNPSQGAVYTIFYIIGFSFPFLLLTFFIGSSRWVMKYSGKIMKIGGTLMVIMGILLFTGQLANISIFLLRLIEGTRFENLG